MAIPLFLQCLIVIGFHGFLLVCIFYCLLYLEGFGNWLGKRKVGGDKGELNET